MIANLTPIILFGSLFILSLYMGGAACDMAAANRKAQSGK
jgi:hypothetical protein